MAKKSFKKSFKTEDNPALSFIAPNLENSNEDEKIEEIETENKIKDNGKNKDINIINKQREDIKENIKEYEKNEMDSTQKGKEIENYTNPVDTVDNYPNKHNTTNVDAVDNYPNKYNTHNNYSGGIKKGPGRPPLEVETKTKRLNLLLLPSLFQDLEKVSTMKRTSVNNLINVVLKEYVEDNKDLIDKYIEVFGE